MFFFFSLLLWLTGIALGGIAYSVNRFLQSFVVPWQLLCDVIRRASQSHSWIVFYAKHLALLCVVVFTVRWPCWFSCVKIHSIVAVAVVAVVEIVLAVVFWLGSLPCFVVTIRCHIIITVAPTT